MSTERHIVDGIAYILPASEGVPRWVRRVGRFAFGCGCRWSSWCIGFDVLSAGLLIQFGPCYVWIAHIERQIAAFDAKRAGAARRAA
jgi:hypothetical protein